MENVTIDWVTNEDGDLLSPITLVEGIQNVSGESFDEILEQNTTSYFLENETGLTIQNGFGKTGSSYSEIILYSNTDGFDLPITKNTSNTFAIDNLLNYNEVIFVYSMDGGDAECGRLYGEKHINSYLLTLPQFTITDFYFWNNVGIYLVGTYENDILTLANKSTAGWFTSFKLHKIIGIKYSANNTSINFPKLFNIIEYMPDYTSSFEVKSEGACSITANKDSITLNWNGSSNIGIQAGYKEPINLTNVNKIKVKANLTSHYSDSFYFSIGVVQNKLTSLMNQSQVLALDNAVHSNELGEITLELNTSELTGLYYLYLFPISSKGTITNIELI